MPQLIINGETQQSKATTIAGLLGERAIPDAHRQSLAVAVNGAVVTRALWDSAPLEDGDAVEIVKPFVGG
jgi:thiamine biosynthesis protein ThiS